VLLLLLRNKPSFSAGYFKQASLGNKLLKVAVLDNLEATNQANTFFDIIKMTK
jgi:hypothetical protein